MRYIIEEDDKFDVLETDEIARLWVEGKTLIIVHTDGTTRPLDYRNNTRALAVLASLKTAIGPVLNPHRLTMREIGALAILYEGAVKTFQGREDFAEFERACAECSGMPRVTELLETVRELREEGE